MVREEKKIVPQSMHGGIKQDILTGVAMTSLMVAMAIYLPLLGFFFTLFIPLPALFYRSKLGPKLGLTVPLGAAAVMVALIGGMAVDVFFFLELLLLGFFLGEFIEKDLPVEQTILYSCTAVWVSGIAGLVLYSLWSGTDIPALLSNYVGQNLELTMALYENMGVSEENIHIIANSLEKIKYVLIRIIPGLVTASTLFVAWLCLLMARPILRARGLFFPDFGALNCWKAPEFLVWPVIVCGLMLLLPINAFKLLAMNGLIILLTAYFFQGIAIVSFYFEKKHLPLMLKFFLYSLIALQQFLLLIVIGLGFFDIWLNFRKLQPEVQK